MLIEYRKSDNVVLGIAYGATEFIDLPITSGSIFVSDDTIVKNVSAADKDGLPLTFVVDSLSLQLPTHEIPPKPKSAEEIRIEQLEVDNQSLLLAVAELYEQVLALQGGGA